MSKFLIVARIVLFVCSEIPTLVGYINAESPSGGFSWTWFKSLSTLDKVYWFFRINETVSNWARKAINRYNGVTENPEFYRNLAEKPEAWNPYSMNNHSDVYNATVDLFNQHFGLKKDSPESVLAVLKALAHSVGEAVMEKVPADDPSRAINMEKVSTDFMSEAYKTFTPEERELFDKSMKSTLLQ